MKEIPIIKMSSKRKGKFIRGKETAWGNLWRSSNPGVTILLYLVRFNKRVGSSGREILDQAKVVRWVYAAVVL